MKKYALVLCALFMALGVSAVATAQGKPAPSGAAVPAAGTVGALGNAQAVDETTLAIGDQAGASPQAGASATGSNTFIYFLRMIFVLALVLVAIWLVFRFMKKAARPKGSSESAIKVLASTSMGQGKAVHLVGLGGKAWLLGASESSVSLIAEIDDKELLDQLSLEAATQSAHPKADFSSILGSLMGKGTKRNPGRGAMDELDPDFLARQRDRLKKY